MGATGIVRSRDMISQTAIACTGEAGQFDSNVPAQLINWWKAGVACSARHLHRLERFPVRPQPFSMFSKSGQQPSAMRSKV